MKSLLLVVAIHILCTGDAFSQPGTHWQQLFPQGSILIAATLPDGGTPVYPEATTEEETDSLTVTVTTRGSEILHDTMMKPIVRDRRSTH